MVPPSLLFAPVLPGWSHHGIFPGASARGLSRPRDDRHMGCDDLVLLARRQGHARRPVASAIGTGKPRRPAHPFATARTGRSTVGWLPDPPPSGASVPV